MGNNLCACELCKFEGMETSLSSNPATPQNYSKSTFKNEKNLFTNKLIKNNNSNLQDKSTSLSSTQININEKTPQKSNSLLGENPKKTAKNEKDESDQFKEETPSKTKEENKKDIKPLSVEDSEHLQNEDVKAFSMKLSEAKNSEMRASDARKSDVRVSKDLNNYCENHKESDFSITHVVGADNGTNHNASSKNLPGGEKQLTCLDLMNVLNGNDNDNDNDKDNELKESKKVKNSNDNIDYDSEYSYESKKSKEKDKFSLDEDD